MATRHKDYKKHISSCRSIGLLLCSLRGQKFCKQVRDLELMDVSHCVAVSDLGIKALSFYCRTLVTLRMAGCPKVNTITHGLSHWLPLFLLFRTYHMSLRLDSSPIFLLFNVLPFPLSDDRHVGAISDRRGSLPTGAWHKRLWAHHRPEPSFPTERLSSAHIRYHALLQGHLQVGQTWKTLDTTGR